MRTQVGIIGAGPAGLMLSHLLHLAGIESVVVEDRSRSYVEQRVRAGVLEHDTVQLMKESGVGERLAREGLVHHGIELRFDGAGHRIDLSGLTGGRTISVYGQQEVVKDLVDQRIRDNGTILYEVTEVTVDGIETISPVISFATAEGREELRCDFVAGCDGFHGITRAAIPDAVKTICDWSYPFAWLGILAAVAPSTDELIYARHDRGFALHSLRSPELSRLYLQVDPGEQLANWSDDRIWSELATRFATRDGWTLHEGPIVERGITPMRSFVTDPMSYGRLFLAGDSAHIVPPTGAKGLNLAVHDVKRLARAIEEHYAHREDSLLGSYSDDCLRRIWRVQHFSWWMTSLLHRFPDSGNIHQNHLQHAELEYVTSSRAAATVLAENYVGLADI
ncbi:MAG TPA: 4-hydroxybenzoate 3-monooxygenase [Acidimicrobiales bacterium]|nr:4-hydroxybenzoate 3-monooxygenase [Acidimicrobiales bacterium]